MVVFMGLYSAAGATFADDCRVRDHLLWDAGARKGEPADGAVDERVRRALRPPILELGLLRSVNAERPWTCTSFSRASVGPKSA